MSAEIKSFMFFYTDIGAYILKPDGKIATFQEMQELIDNLKCFMENVGEEVIFKINQEKKEDNCIVYDASCTNSDSKKPGYVYIIEGLKGQYKIGYTSDYNRRFKQFIKLPFETRLIHLIKTNNMTSLEAHLHNKFSNKRIRGEWFNLDAKDIDWVKKNYKDFNPSDLT